MTTDHRIRHASSNHRDQAIETLMQAFAADPIARWMFPDDGNYRRGWSLLLADFWQVSLLHGGAHITANNPYGTALWYPLIAKPDNKATTDVLIELVAAEKLATFAKVREQMKKFEPRESDPCWYLATLGVDPLKQGCGFGSALLQFALPDFDDRGFSTYLHSSNPINVPLYQHFGFELLGEIQQGDAPVLYPMYRPAKDKN